MIAITKSERLKSLDALRGFDMFWIAGGEIIVETLAKYTNWPIFEWMHVQMQHPAWNGFHFYDMIFPLFLFLARGLLAILDSEAQRTGPDQPADSFASDQPLPDPYRSGYYL